MEITNIKHFKNKKINFMCRKYFILVFIGFIILITTTNCNKNKKYQLYLSREDSIKIVDEILAHRKEVDSIFQNDPSSPFNRDTSVHFNGIKWFPPDVKYYFKSKLYKYKIPESVLIYGTKGEERKHIKYGYFIINFEGKEYRLNVYKISPADPNYERYKNYLSVWFTDETTGKETYQVGRYVDVGDENNDPDFLYTINLNNAYNPYCAYTPLYSCAIPRKEDHLNFAVKAGEMKYHH